MKWKGYDNLFNSWVDKKDDTQSVVFQNYLACEINKVKVKLDLNNYATKPDFKMEQVSIHWIH